MKISSRQRKFELMSVNHKVMSGCIIGISFQFFNIKVCCAFASESPHRGDSNYTQYTIFNIKKENHPKLSQICSYGVFKKEFETAVVNEPSVFEPLKFYCYKINTKKPKNAGFEPLFPEVQFHILMPKAAPLDHNVTHCSGCNNDI